jgi:ribonuclease P protein component
MLPEENRLRESQDFAFARQRGKHWRNEMFILNAAPHSGSASRYGFVIGRKFGSAVKRNRIKRQLRVIIARWMPILADGYDVVMVVRGQAAGRSFATLESSLKQLMVKADLLERQEGSIL